MPAVLMISRYSPPMFDVGGKRVGRFARHLPELGWDPIVLSSPLPRHRPVDPSFEGWPASVVVDRRLVPGWWPEARNRPSDPTQSRPVGGKGPRGPSRRIGALRRHLALPGGPERWLAARSARIARTYAARGELAAIFATSSPYAMLGHGVAAAEATGLPLILDLRDPWSLNFLQAHRSATQRRAEARLEARWLSAAAAIVFTSESTTEAYRSRYPQLAARMHTITNAFDGDCLDPKPRQPGAPLRIVHFGNCYGPRSMAPLLRAIARLCERTRAPEDFELVNLGRVSASDLALAEGLGLSTVLRHHPAVPHAEGMERLREADLQLLLGYGRAPLFIPAKLFDYMRAGSPILAIVGPGEVDDLVEGQGLGRAIAPEAVGAIAEYLERARRERRTLRASAKLDAFSAPATTRQLADLLESVTGGAKLEGRPQGAPAHHPTPASSSLECAS